MLVQRGPGPEKVGKKLGTAEYRYCRWRKEYGGLQPAQAQVELDNLLVEIAEIGTELEVDGVHEEQPHY
jgi:hypothetical protein